MKHLNILNVYRCTQNDVWRILIEKITKIQCINIDVPYDTDDTYDTLYRTDIKFYKKEIVFHAKF